MSSAMSERKDDEPAAAAAAAAAAAMAAMAQRTSTATGVVFHPWQLSFDEDFRADFPAYKYGMVQGKPGGLISTPEYGRNAEMIAQFQPRKSDVWVMTFPKSGTTWMQEIVWLIVNDCDFEGAKAPLNNRSPFLESVLWLFSPFFLEFFFWGGGVGGNSQRRGVIMVSYCFSLLSFIFLSRFPFIMSPWFSILSVPPITVFRFLFFLVVFFSTNFLLDVGFLFSTIFDAFFFLILRYGIGRGSISI